MLMKIQLENQLIMYSVYFFLLGTFSISALTGFNYLGILGAFIAAFFITEIRVRREYIAFSVLVALSLQNLIIGFFWASW